MRSRLSKRGDVLFTLGDLRAHPEATTGNWDRIQKKGDVLTLGDLGISFEPDRDVHNVNDEESFAPVETFHCRTFSDAKVTDYPFEKLYIPIVKGDYLERASQEGIAPSHFSGLTLFPVLYVSFSEAEAVASEGFDEPGDSVVYEIPFDEVPLHRIAVKLNEDGTFRYFGATSKIPFYKFSIAVEPRQAPPSAFHP